MADSNQTFTYCTGPVHVYVRVPYAGSSPYNPGGTYTGSEAIAYLGTTLEAPEFDRNPLWKPHYNTISGDEMPFDEQFKGWVVDINLPLSKHSDTVLAQMEDCPNFGRGGHPGGGFIDVGDIGKFLLANGRAPELWLVNTFWLLRGQALNFQAFPDLRPGYWFRAVRPGRIYRPKDSTDPSLAFINFRALASYGAASRTWLSWSSDPALFNNLPMPL